MMRRAATAMILLLLACRRDATRPVHLYTSTEVAGTGLPQMLVQRFSASSGVKVELQVVTAEELRRRDFDPPAVVLTNDVRLVQSLRGRARLVATIARAGFAVVGPKSDPARIRGLASAPAAFRRITERKRAFCSAADVPAFRAREAAIWDAAGVDPRENRRYRLCHGDPARLLEDVAIRRGYVLVDRAAAAALPPRAGLAVLLEDDALLRDEYTLAMFAGRRPPRNTGWFVQWAMSLKGRELIERHRVEGRRIFVTR